MVQADYLLIVSDKLNVKYKILRKGQAEMLVFLRVLNERRKKDVFKK